jgi:hypothetical protein
MLIRMQLLAIPMPMISILVALCIIFLIILLIVPIHLSLEFSKKGQLLQGSYKIAWFGLILRKGEVLPTSAEDLIGNLIRDEYDDKRDGDLRESKIPEDKGKEGLEKEASEIDASSDFQKPPRLRTFIDAFPAIIKLLRNLFRSIKFQDITCSLCIGTNDPVQTALMSGYFWSIASMLGLFRANFSFEPCFEEEKLEGEFSASLNVRLLWSVIALIDSLREKRIRMLLLEFSRRA